MRREVSDLVGSGLLLAALVTATVATLAPPAGASAARPAAAADPIERGRALFHAKGCIGCHTKAGLPTTGASIGPDLTGLAARAADRRPGPSAEAYVRESIQKPSAFIVPGYAGATFGMPDLHLADDEIDELTAFLLAPEAR